VRDSSIDAVLHAGQAAWPGIVLSRTQLAAHLAPLDDDAARHGSDLYLAAACLAGDTAAIARLDDELRTAGTQAVTSINADRAFVDEALQRLRASLFVGTDGAPRLAGYAGRGPLRAWLGIAPARSAPMLRRSQQRQRGASADDDWSAALTAVSTADPELELLKRQYASAFSAAFRDAVAALEPRLRTVLRMSFIEGLAIDDIGATYAVHRATAARWIQRACESLFDETRRLLAERLALSTTELDRMTSLVRSQLDVTVSQLLPAAI